MAPTSPSSPGSEIAVLYAQGLTQREIAERLGLTQKRVLLAMRREGIVTRGQHRRPGLFGLEKSEGWKGEAATYGAKHVRVYQRRGKASGWLCAMCERVRAKHWANLTGDYNDPTDYAPMCVPCHKRFDLDRREADLRFAVLRDWRSGFGSGGDGL